MIESPEAQFQYAMKLPMQELVSIMQGKPSQISQSVAMMAMQKMNATKTAMQGQQAQQQLAKPSVKDQMMQEAQMPENQGIGQLAAQNMNEVVRAAHGGIIGFADGTSVSAKYNQALRNSAPQSAIDYVGAAAADLASLPGQAVSWDWDEFERTGKLQKKYETSGFFPITRDVADMQAGRSEGYNTPQASETSTGSNVAFDPMRGGVQLRALKDKPVASRVPSTQREPEQMQTGPTSSQAPRPAAPMRGAPTATSSIPGQRQPAYPGDMLEPQTPQQGIAALTSAPTPTPPRTSETFDALQTKFKANTKPYMDEMTAAMKSLTDSPEEKDARGEKRSGIMLIEAAGQLLTGGRSGADSRGAALRSVGKLGQEYAKEDDAAKRAQIGARITMLGSQAQLAQGDAKSAMDMFQHAQNLDQKYAHLEASKAQDAAMNASRDKGHDIDRQKMEGDNAYRRAMIRITEPLNKAHAQYYNALGAAGGTKGQLTPKDLANFRDKAGDNIKDRLSNNPILQAKANKDPALMQQLIATEFARLVENNPSAPKAPPGLQTMALGQDMEVVGKATLKP